jgi:Lar family restriction alleviation protein
MSANKNTPKQDLLPCPFCGGKASFWFNLFFSLHFIRCDKCDAESKMDGHAGWARRAWNRRA